MVFWTLPVVLLITSGGIIDHFRWYYWSLPVVLLNISYGFIVAASCVETTSALSCSHEYHLFGTNDHTAASFKLAILLLMFLLNVSNFPSSVKDPGIPRGIGRQRQSKGGDASLLLCWILPKICMQMKKSCAEIGSANGPTHHFFAQCKLLCQRKNTLQE